MFYGHVLIAYSLHIDKTLFMSGKNLFLKLKRFEYFYYPICPFQIAIAGEYDDDVEQLAHSYLSNKYQEDHVAGDESAIFEYIAKDRFAFRSEWVVDQIEKWHRLGDYVKCRGLMAAYTDARGSKDIGNLVRMIARDQRVLRQIVVESSSCGSIESAINHLYEGECKRDGIGTDSAWDIYKAYKSIADDHERGYLEFYKGNQFSWDEFFEYLSKCLINLKVFYGIE